MRAKLTSETKSLLACTLSNWVAHSSFILIPLFKIPLETSRSALMVISLLAGLTWLVGVRARSALALLVLVPSMWTTSLVYCSLSIDNAGVASQAFIKLDASVPDLLSQSIPLLELLVYLITFGAYLTSTLFWLSASSTSKHPQPSQALNRIEQVTLIPSAQRLQTPYLKSEWILIYWCIVSPLALYLWGQRSTLDPIHQVGAQGSSQQAFSILLSLSSILALIALTLGGSWVLLRGTPPALLYLEERGEWSLSRSWRRWTWLIFALGALLIVTGL